MRRVLVVALALALLAGVAYVPLAAAADECRGLQVCLPVSGPWVVIPARTGAVSTAVWMLRCPLRGYVVGGVDSRVTDPSIDVSFRGENGAPVSPGVTTSDAVLFTATYTGLARKPTSFQPSIGCVPTQGGGGRSQTSVKPGKPLERRVLTVVLPIGKQHRVVARCPAGTRLVGADHSVGLRLGRDPSDMLLRLTSTRRSLVGNTVVVDGRVDSSAPHGLAVELQVHALCARVRG